MAYVTIQLDFPNPLNTSVQIGDTAYFSNPIDYGTTGNPLGGDQWASTTTPHLTSDQGDIIMIGPIQTIIPWDGTVNSIICDMPQALFNQYFSQINMNVVCTPDPSGVNILITDAAFTDHYNLQDPSCLSLPQFNSRADLLDVAFSANNYNTPFLEIGKYPTACNPLLGNVINTAPGMSLGTFVDNGITNCETGNGDCWSRVNAVGVFTLGPLVQFSKASECLDYFINTQAWNLTLTSSFADVVSEATNQNTYFPQSGSITPCYCQEIPLTCTGDGSFIMFSKDNKVNLSSGLGYYASATLRNDSPDKAELFNVGAGIFKSSK